VGDPVSFPARAACGASTMWAVAHTISDGDPAKKPAIGKEFVKFLQPRTRTCYDVATTARHIARHPVSTGTAVSSTAVPGMSIEYWARVVRALPQGTAVAGLALIKPTILKQH
jgi:hypothetical protein